MIDIKDIEIQALHISPTFIKMSVTHIPSRITISDYGTRYMVLRNHMIAKLESIVGEK